MRFDNFSQLFETQPPRILQRGAPLRVGDLRIRPGLQQQPGHFLLVRSAVVEQDRFLQGGPAWIINVIQRDPGVDEDLHGLNMAMLAGWDQRRPAIEVQALHVRPVLYGELQDLVEPLGPGIEKGRILQGVLGVDVATGGNQFPHQFHVVVLGCADQPLVQFFLFSRVKA